MLGSAMGGMGNNDAYQDVSRRFSLFLPLPTLGGP